jgi:hypothetical protein
MYTVFFGRSDAKYLTILLLPIWGITVMSWFEDDKGTKNDKKRKDTKGNLDV